eukprot:SAG31_NODE_2223_length_6152_cov_4.129688_5_plen_219_part_00
MGRGEDQMGCRTGTAPAIAPPHFSYDHLSYDHFRACMYRLLAEAPLHGVGAAHLQVFDDLLNWNTWMWARRREEPLLLLSWGSNPYPYAPDGKNRSHATDLRGTGGGGANLESGLDNGPVMEGVPFNQSGLYLQDEYDAGYTGMYLMDCKAQIALAKMIGRTDAAATLQSRFDTVNKAMLGHLWNASASYFQNKLSLDLVPVERMAPTHFCKPMPGPA